LAGATIGPLASTVSTVENLIKTQLQLDNVTANRYKGSLDCLRQLVRENGLRVLYTGHLVNTTREMVFLTTYFGVYEGLREYFFHFHEGEHPLAIPAAGGLSGAIAWAVSFPLDCVRAGVQVQNMSGPRRSAWTVFHELISRRGISGLYSGVTPSIIRACLVSGSRFTAYEGALWFLRGGRDVQYHNFLDF
jgi:solute carrier family 25 carnitine/acylcarnitine transporter 20/29